MALSSNAQQVGTVSPSHPLRAPLHALSKGSTSATEVFIAIAGGPNVNET